MLLTTLDDVYDYIQEQLRVACSQVRPEFVEHTCNTDRGVDEWTEVYLENVPNSISIDFQFPFRGREGEVVEEIVCALNDFSYYIEKGDYTIVAKLASLRLSGGNDIELTAKIDIRY